MTDLIAYNLLRKDEVNKMKNHIKVEYIWNDIESSLQGYWKQYNSVFLKSIDDILIKLMVIHACTFCNVYEVNNEEFCEDVHICAVISASYNELPTVEFWHRGVGSPQGKKFDVTKILPLI